MFTLWHVRWSWAVVVGGIVAGLIVARCLPACADEHPIPVPWDSIEPLDADGFGVTQSRRDLDQVRSYLAAGRRDKALTGMLRVRQRLLVDLQVDAVGNAGEFQVRVSALGRSLPDSISVELRLPDHGDLRMRLRKNGNDLWSGSMNRDVRLAVYDYDGGDYAPDTGPIAVQAEVVAGRLAGASPIVLWTK